MSGFSFVMHLQVSPYLLTPPPPQLRFMRRSSVVQVWAKLLLQPQNPVQDALLRCHSHPVCWSLVESVRLRCLNT